MLHVVIFVKFVAVLSISIIRLWLTSISMKLYFKIWQLKGIQMENSMMLLHISLFYRRIIEMHKGLRYMSLWETTPYCEERLLMSPLWSGRKGRGGLPSVLILHLSRSITDDKTDGKLQLNRQNCWEILRVTSNIFFLFKD